jgi:hypothetical protein
VTALLSAREPAAVDVQRRTVDIICGGGRHKNRDFGDVFGLAPTSGRNSVKDPLVARGVGPQGIGLAGLDTTRRNGVGVNNARRSFIGHQFGDSGNACVAAV